MPREGHDPLPSFLLISLHSYFNPRAPRGARRAHRARYRPKCYFNPRAPRGARLAVLSLTSTIGAISIHVPREGHDYSCKARRKPQLHFNPRAPRGARLSHKSGTEEHSQYFNPRAPRGARPALPEVVPAPEPISIHVPREGHDYTVHTSFSARDNISIHVPREGHDSQDPAYQAGSMTFQSTCPARGTTPKRANAAKTVLISIHVPREGHDNIHKHHQHHILEFQSTCPARGTTS